MNIRHPTWLEIDTDAIRHNCVQIIQDVGTPLLAIVKADAYGHGVVRAAKSALQGGASWLGVARYCEARILRQAGLNAPVLVLGMATQDEVDEAIADHVTLTLHNEEALRLFLSRAKAAGQALEVHLKVDSGLGRLGIMAEETSSFAAQFLSKNQPDGPGLRLSGIFSHLSKGEDASDPLNRLQKARFDQAVKALHSLWQNSTTERPDLHGYPFWVHLANSGGAFFQPELRYNLVRVGNVCYGIRIRVDTPLPDIYKPALRWKARLVSCRLLPEGWGVGYGATYLADGNSFIGVVSVGFGDGLRQIPGNRVLIGGEVAPVVGRLSLDQMMVLLPHTYSIGEEVIIIGEQGDKAIWVHDLARLYAISQVDFTTLIHHRVPRIER